MSEELTENQAQEMLRQFSEGKQSFHAFLTNVIKAKDSTKIGNVNAEELGNMSLPVRTYQELAVFSKEIADEPEWSNYFTKLAEISLATSLSKEGFLLKTSITSNKTIADLTGKNKKANKGWFGSKKKEGEE